MEKTTAAQVIIALIPIVGIVMGSGVVFFYLLWNYKQKVLLIQTKQYEKPVLNLTLFSLFTGLLLGGVGLFLTIFLFLSLGSGMGLLGGLIPLAIGVSLLFFFGIRRKLQV